MPLKIMFPLSINEWVWFIHHTNLDHNSYDFNLAYFHYKKVIGFTHPISDEVLHIIMLCLFSNQHETHMHYYHHYHYHHEIAPIDLIMSIFSFDMIRHQHIIIIILNSFKKTLLLIYLVMFIFSLAIISVVTQFSTHNFLECYFIFIIYKNPKKLRKI